MTRPLWRWYHRVTRHPRAKERVLLVVLLLGAVVGLVLVVRRVILPRLPHTERVPLELHLDARVMSIDTYRQLPNNHRPSSKVRQYTPVCWLSIQFLVDEQLGAARMFTSYLDLPWGNANAVPAPTFLDACAPALELLERHPRDSRLPLWVEPEDHNNVYLNESITGAMTPDWIDTYSASADPPGLQIFREVGEGIGLGSGFLLSLCIICVLLPIGACVARWYEDRHQPAHSLSEHAAEEQRMKAREDLAFTPLEDQDEKEANERAARTPRQDADIPDDAPDLQLARPSRLLHIEIEMQEEKSTSFRHSRRGSDEFVDEEIMEMR